MLFGQAPEVPADQPWAGADATPPLLVVELPDSQVPGLSLPLGMKLPLPLSTGARLEVSYQLIAVILFNGGHYVCDARDPDKAGTSWDRVLGPAAAVWHRYDGCNGRPGGRPAVATETQAPTGDLGEFWPVVAAYCRWPCAAAGSECMPDDAPERDNVRY